jgi:uncharacterized membrane protein
MDYRSLGKKLFWWPIAFVAFVLVAFVIVNTLLGAAESSADIMAIKTTANYILGFLGTISVTIGLLLVILGIIFYLIGVFSKKPGSQNQS